MTLDNLQNLAKTRQLKAEPPDQQEYDGMVSSAKRRLADAQNRQISEDSQFSLAYGAAHSLALAALRWHGYRSKNRFLVFQCLQQTVNLDTEKWLVLDQCHKKRNLAEYEGNLDISYQLLKDLIHVTNELLELVEALEPIDN